MLHPSSVVYSRYLYNRLNRRVVIVVQCREGQKSVWPRRPIQTPNHSRLAIKASRNKEHSFVWTDKPSGSFAWTDNLQAPSPWPINLQGIFAGTIPPPASSAG